MKNDNSNLPLSRGITKVLFSQSHSSITNIAANWWPTVGAEMAVKSMSMSCISLATTNGAKLTTGLIRLQDGRLGLARFIISSNKKAIVAPEVLPKCDYVYLEIDVNPRNSQVTFWANDRGFDMGVLPGFEGGVQQASWGARTHANGNLLNVKLTNCAYATATGWVACDLGKCDIGHQNLQDHHHVEQLSQSSFAIGARRLTA